MHIVRGSHCWPPVRMARHEAALYSITTGGLVAGVRVPKIASGPAAERAGRVGRLAGRAGMPCAQSPYLDHPC